MKSVASQALIYGRRRGAILSLLLLFSILDIVFTVLTPWPLKLIVDNVLTGEPLPEALAWAEALPGAVDRHYLLAWLVSTIFLLFLGRELLKFVSSYLQSGVMSRIKNDLAADVFTHLQELPMSFYSGHKAGDLVRRVISDTDFVRVFIANVFLPSFVATGTLFAMFWIMWEIQPLLSLLALMATLPIPVLIRVLTPKISEQAYAFNEAEGALMAAAEQTITALPIVQLNSRESREEKRFRDLSLNAIQTNLRSTSTGLKFSLSVGSVTAIGTSALMILGGLQVLENALTLGTLLLLLSYLASTYAPLETLSGLVAQYATSKGQAKRVFEVLDCETETHGENNSRPLMWTRRDKGITIEFENVQFGYQAGEAVLKNINLKVSAGDRVALVGESGAGKTTMAYLMARFYHPWTGRVLMDGIDIQEIGLASLRDQIGIVLQESFLLPVSVAENIAYGNPRSSREEIIAAAVAANADEFINNLPRGYDTVIGERGSTLSGGQRQRLSIARALLKNPPLLILDEPTSALDAKTELLLMEAVEHLMENRTTLIISHRLSTIRNANIIAVLRGGSILATGTHDELIANNDYYKYLNELQTNANT